MPGMHYGAVHQVHRSKCDFSPRRPRDAGGRLSFDSEAVTGCLVKLPKCPSSGAQTVLGASLDAVRSQYIIYSPAVESALAVMSSLQLQLTTARSEMRWYASKVISSRRYRFKVH